MVTKWKHIVSVTALVLLCGVIFANTFKNAFIWDDADLIVADRHIRSLRNIPFLFAPQYWNRQQQTSSQGQYRPVRAVTFALDYALWGFNVQGYHLTNLLLHTLNSILIYVLILQLLRPRSRKEKTQQPGRWFETSGVALVTALLFAAYPIHVESVTWVKNRSDLLTLLFFLLSFLLFTGVQLQEKKRRRSTWYVLSLFCFAGSLCSKEMAVSLPLILILHTLCFVPRGEWKGTMFKILPFFGILLAYVLFKLACLGMVVSEENAGTIGFYPNMLAVLKTFGYYARLLVFPFDLNAERPFVVPQSLLEPAVCGSILLAVIVVAFVIKVWKQSKLLVFGILWILVTILPASNLVFLAGRPIAEQRLYIPSLGFCFIVALGILRLWSLQPGLIPQRASRGLIVLMLAVLVGLYAATVIKRNADWKDPFTFWSKTVAASPHSSKAHIHLGNALLDQGEVKQAIRHYKEALRINRGFPETYNSLGNALWRQGKVKEAVRHYTEALRIKPDYAEAHNNLGNALLSMGEVKRAMDHYREALRLKPDYLEAHCNLGNALLRQGRLEEAATHYAEALQLNPELFQGQYYLAEALLKQGKLQEAVYHYAEAVRIKPGDAKAHFYLATARLSQGALEEAVHHYAEALRIEPDYVEAHNNLGIILARQGKLDQAISHFSEAVKIQPTFAEAHYNLGNAFLNQGNIEQAIQQLAEALRLKPDHRKAKEALDTLLKEKKAG